MTGYSVKDVAEIVRRPSEDVQNAIDRVRNWTKEGLLTVAGEKHPGTGRARQYGPEAALEAALLQILIDCIGTSALRAARILKGTIALILLNKPKRGDPVHTFLVIAKFFGAEEGSVAIRKGPALAKLFSKKPAADTYTVVDLNLLFDRVIPPKE